jgi:hypothetical protein
MTRIRSRSARKLTANAPTPTAAAAMAGTLFDDRSRSGPAYKTDGESVFDFYNRVDRPEWARARDELEDWYSQYPDDNGDLRKRFRKPGADQHFGAWWELWVYTFYRLLGYEVTPHPTMPNGTKPDFLVSRNGRSTYVECKAIPEKSRSANEPGYSTAQTKSITLTSYLNSKSTRREHRRRAAT